jgi:metallo-beta-lactamase family protein
VREAVARGGALLVPAFAVGRTQELLWILRQLEDEDRIPSLPVFVDSPMAINVTEIYTRHPEDHNLDMQALVANGAHGPFSCRQLRLLRTSEESKALNARSGPMIIVSASGMATGGRVLHHLKLRLPDPQTTVLLPGFQAAGTRGRSLADGAHTLRMHGQDIPVRARVVTLDGLSAHADRDEILRWLSAFTTRPRRTYVVHGEPAQAESLATTIRTRLGWDVHVAGDGETVPLGR